METNQQHSTQPDRDAELDKIRLDRLDKIMELERQRDELHRLWDSSAAEARRNKAQATKLAEALQSAVMFIDAIQSALAEWEAREAAK